MHLHVPQVQSAVITEGHRRLDHRITLAQVLAVEFPKLVFRANQSGFGGAPRGRLRQSRLQGLHVLVSPIEVPVPRSTLGLPPDDPLHVLRQIVVPDNGGSFEQAVAAGMGIVSVRVDDIDPIAAPERVLEQLLDGGHGAR